MTSDTADPRVLGLHRHLLVSERLRMRRHQLGLTQKEVVARLRLLGIDTTNKALSSLEHGAGLDVGKLPELACALDCTLTYLVGLSSDPTRWEPNPEHWPTPARAHSNGVTHSNGVAHSNGVTATANGDAPRIIGPMTSFSRLR